MTKDQETIINIIKDYLDKNPGIRFGQALYDLGINQFANLPNPEEAQHKMRDIYNDTDLTILKRMK